MSSRRRAGHENVLVLCSANVTRSPLAASLMRRNLAQVGHSDVRVTSAGLQAAPGTPASPEVIEVARHRGLDLSRHAAREVTRGALERSALVLTMSENQRSAVARLVPCAITRTFTLPELCRLLSADDMQFQSLAELAWRAHRARPLTAPAAEVENVADPNGRTLRHFERMADRLTQLVHQVSAHVRPRVSGVPA